MLSRRSFLGGGLTLALSSGPALRGQSSTASPWPEGSRGAVSITYDDGLDSQLDLAVPTLDALGLKATFFVTLDNIQHRLADWAALAEKGHELADHTFSHPCDLRRYTPREFLERQINPTERWLDSVDPRRRNPSFAYPCDATNLGRGTPNVQARRYARVLSGAGVVAARTSEGEPNNPFTVRRRAHRLQALAIGYDAPNAATVSAYLSLAERRGHWAILIFHELAAEAVLAGDVSQAMHDEMLSSVKLSSLWPATVGAVLSRLL